MDTSLCFIGDSMIANWDVDRCFPNRITENKGIDGIGIADLTNVALSDISADVIMLIGTNDLNSSMTDNQIVSYSDDYLSIIQKFEEEHLLLISVLPTANKDKNNTIANFNKLIKNKTSDNPNIVYIDCYDSFLRDGMIKEELTRDGTHLNDYGYMLLTNIVKERL